MFEKMKTKERLFWIIDVLIVEQIERLTYNKDAIECAKKIYDGNFDSITDKEIHSFYYHVILPVAYGDYEIDDPFLKNACSRTIDKMEPGEIHMIYNHKF